MFSRMLWVVLAIVVLVFGGLGLLALSIGALIGWSALGMVIGFVVWQCVALMPKAREMTGVTHSDWAIGAEVAVGVLVVGVVSTGMAATIGAAEATAVLLVAIAAWAGRLLWSGSVFLSGSPLTKPSGPPAAPAVVVTPAPPMTAAADLTTGALCLAWRRSYVKLQQSTDEPTRQRVVRLREQYLDELERRDRAGFARWLGSGARAGSDPQRYLTAGG
jgi:hypothetical protein